MNQGVPTSLLLCLWCDTMSSMVPSAAMPPDNLDFAWDRYETAASLKRRLDTTSGAEWLRTAAWLMREARVEQVWQFVTLQQVADAFPQISPMLGKRRPVWEHLLRAAHELGRI